MKNTTAVLLSVSLALAGAGVGTWWGSRDRGPEAAGTAAGQAAAVTAEAPRRILYYRNPMGLPDTSPVPRKDPMGMDYIPVYEGEAQQAAASPGQVRISPERVQLLGVRTEAAALRPLGRVVRASGRVEPDERRIYAVTAKFEGYVERLHVNVTGQPVGRGQPLFEVYSPELVAAQREYLVARQGVQALAGTDASAGMQRLAESSLQRLRNWDMTADQVDALARSGEVRRTITFRSPVGGVVTEKKALQGMRFQPGEALYQVTDLGSVWVIADLFEQDIALAKAGAKATVRLAAYPDKAFEGTVTYVYPTLNAGTRTVPVRIELRNPGQLLKPAMYAQVELGAGDPRPVLTVPDSAVIDSGTRRIVLVQVEEGRFEPREVRLGARGEAHVQVLEGVREGEQVVVAANFLIDAESNLKAALGSLGGTPGQPAAGAAAAPVANGASQPAAGAVAHKARGTVDGIDAGARTLSLNHGAVPSLKWPAMTMDFRVANAGLLRGLAPGAAVDFEFVERRPGDWMITSITPAPATPAASTGTPGHSRH